MCCPGCQAVAHAIVASGHKDFYKFRTEAPPTGRELVPEFIQQTEVYDHPDIQRSFVRHAEGTIREASLIIEGITCAACIWLNERHLTSLPGVTEARINYSTHRARVRWDDSRIRLSEILRAIRAIGYEAHPYDPLRQQQIFEHERSNQLRRIGVSGVLGMQVMILSVALYAGDWSGMEAGYATFFRWLGLLLTLPVLLYSAAPFFRGAWRDLSHFSAGMDVPVSLGLLVAFTGSVHATLTGRGHVYYDSVVMFVFFLLVSRYFEIMARKRGAETAERLGHSVPALATRLSSGPNGYDEELVPVAELQPADRVLIRPGDTVPADGLVTDGKSTVNESLLTGESTPVTKDRGSSLVGGSINIDSPLQMRVERVGAETILAGIMRMLDDAQGHRPPITRAADRIASWFVAGVVLLACLVAWYWWQHQPDAWLPITVAVLVVTCPCALSLATPTAISAASGALMSTGLLTTRGDALETLARSTHFVFDKTGTLTRGCPAVVTSHALPGTDNAGNLQVAVALESHSEHPIAQAITGMVKQAGSMQAINVVNTPGAGLSGRIDGHLWHIGAPAYIHACTGQYPDAGLMGKLGQSGDTVVLLADDVRIHHAFTLRDEVREGAPELIRSLQHAGIKVLLLTGDHQEAASRVAKTVGITDVHAEASPQDKLIQVRCLQEEGAVVAMIGDGINDAPVLSAADVSIAMHSASSLAHASADLVLLSDKLGNLLTGTRLAGKTLRIIRQNLGWAVTYNLVALPAAAMGYIAPWMAAIGMSCSSLLVVLNALRLTRRRPVKSGPGPHFSPR